MFSRAFILICFLIATPGHAGQIQENFLDSTYKDPASTAVWNQTLHYIHPPLAVTYGQDNNTEDSLDADIGDGSDGVFDNTTYSKFGTVSTSGAMSTLILNTDAHRVFNFTTFTLDSNWKISGTGSQPLWFKVQGTAIINGTIDCSGGNGDPVDAVTNAPAHGGLGRCGGANGGDGGYNGTAGTSGSSGGGASTGGAPGGSAANGSGGGGGGGFRDALFVAQAGIGASGGAAGNTVLDPRFTIFGSTGPGGGSGGGGGGYGTIGSRGGGGGAGGGVIRITAGGGITIGAAGAVLAQSGKGGGGANGGGGGGGGAGGSIWMQTPGTIQINGVVDASTNSTTANGGVAANSGGRGCDGRTWLVSKDHFAQGNPETPASDNFNIAPFVNGQVHYSVAPYVAQSKIYDARNTGPSFTKVSAVTVLPGTSTYTLLAAGSNDNFLNDSTGWLPVSDLTPFKGKRWFKFKINLQLNSVTMASTPLQVPSVTATFDGAKQNQFDFKSACGNLGSPGEGLFFIGFLIFLFLVFRKILRRTREIQITAA